MSTTPSPTQSESSISSLPVRKPLVEVLAINPADLKNDTSQSARAWLGKRALLALALITFCIGVAAASAWLSYGNAARETIASSFPQLAWLAPQTTPISQNAPDLIEPASPAAPSPDQQPLNAMSLDLDGVRQSIDRIATSIITIQEQITHTIDRQEQITHSIDRIATSIPAGQEQLTRSVDRITASREQIARSVDQLVAGQEQLTREIAKLRAIELSILYKSSELFPPRPAPASARKPVPRSAQPQTAR